MKLLRRFRREDGYSRTSQSGLTMTGLIALGPTLFAVAIAAPRIADYRHERDALAASKNQLHRIGDAMTVYHREHGTYRGATSDVLHSTVDPDLDTVNTVVIRAGADAFCAEASRGDHVWHLTTPRGRILDGPCS